MLLKYFILPLFIWSVSLHASYTDFVRFAEMKQGHTDNESILKVLYEQFLAPLSSSSQPILIALGGSPGAGKTTFRKKFLKMQNIHIHDMDEVMVQLPGYQEDLAQLGTKKAFEKWWPSAQAMARMIVQYAIESRYSIIYDRTCGTEGSYFDLLSAKECGYYIRMVGLFVSKDVAKERIIQREREEGRTVTEEILIEYRSRFSALWPHYLKVVDEAFLYQTDTNTPVLLYSSSEGIKEPHLYQRFLDVGEPFSNFFSKIGEK